MRKQDCQWISIVMTVLILAVVAILGCSISKSGPDAGTRSTSGGMPQEGIKVHGNWTIEVINPDGTLADRREFNNALGSA